jgi:hypothetical protein
VAVHEVLSALAEPRNRALITLLLSDPEVLAAGRALGGAVVGGMVDALTEPERQARVRGAVRRFIAAVAEESGRALDTLRPHVVELTGALVEEAMVRLVSERFEGRALALVQNVGDGVGEATRMVAREMIIGVDDGLRALGDAVEVGLREPSTLSRIEETSEGLPTMLWLALAGIGLALAALVVWIVLLVRRLGRLSQRLERPDGDASGERAARSG